MLAEEILKKTWTFLVVRLKEHPAIARLVQGDTAVVNFANEGRDTWFIKCQRWLSLNMTGHQVVGWRCESLVSQVLTLAFGIYDEVSVRGLGMANLVFQTPGLASHDYDEPLCRGLRIGASQKG